MIRAFVVIHVHEYGNSCYTFGWEWDAEKPTWPTEDDVLAAEILAAKFEPDKDEHLEIYATDMLFPDFETYNQFNIPTA